MIRRGRQGHKVLKPKIVCQVVGVLPSDGWRNNHIILMMRIRAHHLLCMQGFQGYGYNQEFVSNMAQAIKDMNSCPDLEVEIIVECDIICFHCPHNKAGVCQKRLDSAQKVRDMDMHVLRKLGIREGAKGKVKDILALVNTALKNISDIQDVCGDCEWKEKCLWFISRSQKDRKSVTFDARNST